MLPSRSPANLRSRPAYPPGAGGTAQSHRLLNIVDPGHHGDDNRRGHDQPAHGLRRAQGRRQHVQADRDHLEQGLQLAATAGRDYPAADDPEPQHGHAQLAEHDHAGDPPGQLAERGQADQGRPGQRLVGYRVRDLAEIGHQPAAASQPPVEQVGQRRDAERHERGQPPDRPAREHAGHEHRNQEDPHHREHVGDIDQPRLGSHPRPGRIAPVGTIASAIRSTPSDPVTTARTMSPGASGAADRTVVTPSTSGA